MFDDGRVETEFDLDTGEPLKWGTSQPEGLIEVGWVPMTDDLKSKILKYGEYGVNSHRGTPVIIRLRPGDRLIIFRDGMIVKGALAKCKACNHLFRTPKPPRACPKCGVTPELKCDICDRFVDTADGKCDNCGADCRVIIPFSLTAHAWEECTYLLGIAGVFLMRFTPDKLVTVLLPPLPTDEQTDIEPEQTENI